MRALRVNQSTAHESMSRSVIAVEGVIDSPLALVLGVGTRDQAGCDRALAYGVLPGLKTLPQACRSTRDLSLRVVVAFVGHHARDIIPAHRAIDPEDE